MAETDRGIEDFRQTDSSPFFIHSSSQSVLSALPEAEVLAGEQHVKHCMKPVEIIAAHLTQNTSMHA